MQNSKSIFGINRKIQNQVGWCIPVIPGLRRLRQENFKIRFKANLGYLVDPYLKRKRNRRKKIYPKFL
jgi:hypothetical protein